MTPDLEIEPFELEIEPDPPAPAQAIEPTPVRSEQALAQSQTSLVEQAKALQITSPEAFEQAGHLLVALKDFARQVEDFWAEDIARAHAAWKGLTTKRASYLDPLKDAITVLSARYAAFAQEQKRLAEKARREEEERLRKLEQERLAAEAKAREEEAKRLEAEAKAADSYDERRAIEAEAHQAKAEAADLRQEAATVQAPVLPDVPAVALPKGTSVRANWTFRVDDKLALIKAVAAGEVSPESLDVSTTYFTKRAKADKDSVRIPGVTFYDAGSVATRRAR